jgi:hypothetical protein
VAPKNVDSGDDLPDDETLELGLAPAREASPYARTDHARTGSGQAHPHLAAGDLIADRYQVIRYIAGGGMGEVYECDDRLLGEAVALKTIRADIAHDQGIVERFRREIQLARRVTHPGVCRIFDVGLHRANKGESPMVFLTMELLRGETLAVATRKRGKWSTAEALPIALQLCEGLAAAHAADVVHRDFKPQNVILASASGSGSSSGGLRSVITDFGLARARLGVGGGDAVTGVGGIVGSPAYMAPEQVDGSEVAPASDIYALGIVLYELTTGKLPFVGDTPLATAAKRLRSAPRPPRELVPELEPAWNDDIMACLERDPGARPRSALEVARRLSAAAGRGRRRRRVAATILAGLAFAAVVVGWAIDRVPPTTASRLSAAPEIDSTKVVDGEPMFVLTKDGLRRVVDKGLAKLRALGSDAPCARAVAVMGFRNTAGSPATAWISGALVEMLNTELAAGGALRTVPAERIARVKRDLGLIDTESYAEDTLGKLRQNLCATHVLVGAYLIQGEGDEATMRVDVRLQDTATGDTIAQAAEIGKPSDLFGLVEKIGAGLRTAVGVGPEAGEPGELRQVLPQKSEAAALYTKGSAALAREECRDASQLLEEAIKVEPDFPQAHIRLADALYCVGYEDRSRKEVELAMTMADRLPMRERLLLEARDAQMRGDKETALARYKALWALDDGDLEIGLSLMGMQIGNEQLADARRTLATLRRLPGPDREHPRIDETEASLELADGHPELARAALERGLAHAQARGAKLMEGAVRMQLASRDKDEGHFDQAAANAAQIVQIGKEYGDRELEAVGYDVQAALATMRGDLARAETLAKTALAIIREVGLGRRMAAAVWQLATVQVAMGELDTADRTRKLYQPMIGESVSWKQARAAMAAQVAMWRGDLHGAVRILEATPVTDESSATSGLHLAWMLVERARGNDAEAMRRAGLLTRQAEPYRGGTWVASIDLEILRTQLAHGDLDAVLRRGPALLASLDRFGMVDTAAETRAVLATAMAQRGDASGATALLAPAIARQSHSLITETRVATARAKVLGAIARSHDRDGDIASDASRAGAAERTAAIVDLGKLVTRLRSAGLGGLALESGMALAELERASGREAASRTTFGRVVRDAERLGWTALAQVARTALRG